jgi:hypothetical protein
MNPLETEFLQEPAWRWAVFAVAMLFFLEAWKGVVKEIW